MVDFSAHTGTNFCMETTEKIQHIVKAHLNLAEMHGMQQHIHPIAI